MSIAPKHVIFIIILMFLAMFCIDLARFGLAQNKMQTNLEHLAKTTLVMSLDKAGIRMGKPTMEGTAEMNNVFQGLVPNALTFYGMPVEVDIVGESTDPPMIALQASSNIHSWLFGTLNAWLRGEAVVQDVFPVVVQAQAIMENKNAQ